MAVSQTLKLYPGTQDVVNNTSKLRILWKSTQTGDSRNNNTRTAKYWVSINGGAEKEYSVSYKLPKGKTKTILDTTITVPHDDFGNCKVAVRTWMDTKISAGVVQKSASITLTPIPRANTITAQDAYIGGTLRIAVARKSAAYLHTVTYQFGTVSGTIAADSAATEYELDIPDNWDVQMPDAKEKTITLTCVTYVGSSEIGRSTATAKVKTPATFAPVVSAKVVDINPVTIDLTGNASRLIRGASTAKATIEATALRGATIKSTKINGVSAEDLEVEAVQNGTFTFSATDSRDYTTEQAVNLSVIPYIPLSAIIEAERGAQGTNGLNVTVKGNYYSGTFGAEVNTLTLQYRVNGGAWQSVTPTIDGKTYAAEIALELDYQTTHNIDFRIADKVRTLNITRGIPRAIPLMMEGENWVRFNVPVYNVLPRYASDSDNDETALEAWLDELLAGMPSMSSMQIAFNCYPAVVGTTVFATLSKYSSDSYAVMHGASYNGATYLKTKQGVWSPTTKEVHGQ